VTQIKWNNTTIKLGDLVPWEHNPRYSTEVQAERITDSHRVFGQAETLAIDAENNVLNGHQRLNAWLAEYGPDFEIDARKADKVFDEAEKQAFTAMLHVAAVGSWNFTEIANWGWDADELASFGFDDYKIKEWHDNAFSLEELRGSNRKEEPGEDTEPQIDKAAELQKKWKTELGQLWQLGEHRLICGDCTDEAVVERAMGGEKANLQLTDPPYGINLPGNANRFGIATDKSRKSTKEEWDKSIPDKQAFDNIFATSKNQIVFGANYFWEYFYSSQCYIIWDKRGDMPDVPFADTEFAWTSFVKKPSVKYTVINHGFIRDEKEDRLHPTQKPLKLWTNILEDFSKDSELIADFFDGSGTTIIACQNLNRRCRAIEIDPGYVAVSLERYFQHTGIKPVLIK